MADDDARDERLAAWLEPEPLDDVTRRRLVSTAMRETRPSHAVRWIATAAAIAVVLVGGFALLTANGGNDDGHTAAPALTPANERSKAADSAAPEAATAAGAPVDVGDFGNLDRADNLDRLRSALENAAPSSFATTSGDATAGTLAPLSLSTCSAIFPGGTILAQGRGAFGHRAAVVLLTELNGTRSVDAILEDPCEVRVLGTG